MYEFLNFAVKIISNNLVAKRSMFSFLHFFFSFYFQILEILLNWSHKLFLHSNYGRNNMVLTGLMHTKRTQKENKYLKRICLKWE